MTIFETPRLIVRSVLDADFPYIFRLQSDPDTMRYIRAPVTNEQTVRERMAMWEEYGRKYPGLGTFSLESKVNGAFAGYVVARHADFKPEIGEYEIGYVLVPEWRGQGLTTEVVPPLCRYLFEKTGAPHIVAFTDPTNAVSQRVLRKCGFTEIGTRQIYDGLSAEFRLERP